MNTCKHCPFDATRKRIKQNGDLSHGFFYLDAYLSFSRIVRDKMNIKTPLKSPIPIVWGTKLGLLSILVWISWGTCSSTRKNKPNQVLKLGR